MTTIQLHPRSLVLGLAIGACALFAMAQSAPQYASTVRVQYMPHPRDMVQIEEGVPYVVPAGKVFVLTGLGSATNASGVVGLAANGTIEVEVKPEVGASGTSTDTTTMKHVPLGFTAPAGASLDVVGGNPPMDARAWGYLADQ